MSDRVEFVSYNGKFPNLCGGTLVLKIEGNCVELNHCLFSGGRVWFDEDWTDHVDSGKWTVDVPEKYKSLTDEIAAVVNENIEYGCCGGCV